MSLRKATIRLAYERPELRAHLLPLLARTAAPLSSEEAMQEAMDMLAGRTWGKGDHGKGKPGDVADDKPYPYNERNLGPGGCNKGKKTYPDCYADRKKYNNRYRKEVCPSNHKTTCGNPALKE